MTWRIGWPPWESEQVRVERERALQEVEQAASNLDATRESIARGERIFSSITAAGRRNHFSEAMETLFASVRPHHPPGGTT